MNTSIFFFGSFQHYSSIILEHLLGQPNLSIKAVITTPPKPAGRKQTITPTHVHTTATSHQLPVFTPEELSQDSLDQLTSTYGAPDFFLVAGYSKILPESWLSHPSQASINIHFSLLPAYRGAMPAEYALLRGETQTGVTSIVMTPGLDQGPILEATPLAVFPTDTRETLYQRLYTEGAQLAASTLANFAHLTPLPQPAASPTPYCKLLDKAFTFINWQLVNAALEGRNSANLAIPELFHLADPNYNPNTSPVAPIIERAIRAFAGWPGVWTIIDTPKGRKRLKLLSSHVEKNKLLLDQVQLEGKNPSVFTKSSFLQ